MSVAADAVVRRGNVVVIAAMSTGFLAPMVIFWARVWGPLRPGDLRGIELAPSAAAFLAGVALCGLPYLLPGAWFRPWEGARGRRVYRALGVPGFRRWVTNGDAIQRSARRRDAAHRGVSGADGARRWLRTTHESERGHLALLLAGAGSGAYAASIGWTGWAAWLTASNLVFNLDPVLLQRHQRLLAPRVAARAASSPAGER